jgi:hypothetical protein
MAKYTLLEIVQNIASAIDSDAVNSISDTVEAYQIAMEVRTAYDEVLATLKIPSKESLILLDALTDPDRPNYLKIPDSCKMIQWFKYDYQNEGIVGDYQEVWYLTPDEFIMRTRQLAGGDPTAIPYSTITDFSGAQLNIITNKNPQWWTTFDNSYIVTDSYNIDQDTTLQQSKSLCWGQNNLNFLMSDTYVPELDDDLFPLLIAEAKSACFANLKQTTSPKDEQRARRNRVQMQDDLWRANQRRPYDRIPNYGRARGGLYVWPFPRIPSQG